MLYMFIPFFSEVWPPQKKEIWNRKIHNTLCLHSASNRGTRILALPAQLDVASQVRVGGLLRSGVALHAEGALVHSGHRHDQLHLAERTARRHDGLAHVAQLASTRTVDGRGVARALGGATRACPGSRGEAVRRLRVGVDTTSIGQRGHGNEVASISRDLLDKRRNRGHLILYSSPRKKIRTTTDFSHPEKHVRSREDESGNFRF